jgi:hypothetical protein
VPLPLYIAGRLLVASVVVATLAAAQRMAGVRGFGAGAKSTNYLPSFRDVVRAAVSVNMMNTDEPGPRISTSQWDRLVAAVMAAGAR